MIFEFSEMAVQRIFKRIILLVLLIVSSESCFAQKDHGVVRFQVDNENGYFEVLLNDTLLLKQYQVVLKGGTYNAKVWSYGYDQKDISFTVLEDTVNYVYVKLDRSAAYGAYEQSYHNYRKQFHKSITFPLTLTLAMGVTSSVFMLNAFDLKKEIISGIESYNMTPQPDEIATIKETVEENNRKYSICRTGYYVTGGLMLIGVAGSIYSGLKFKRNYTEPTFSKASPFNSKSSFFMTPYGVRFIYTFG